jgi:hypothetical protein
VNFCVKKYGILIFIGATQQNSAYALGNLSHIQAFIYSFCTTKCAHQLYTIAGMQFALEDEGASNEGGA